MQNNQKSNLEQLIRRNQDATFTDEYNSKLRRLFPWPGKVNTKRTLTEFGCMYMTLACGDAVDLHSHDEEETFIVIGGEAVLHVDGEETTILPGDVAYIPRFSQHSLRNPSASVPFQMIDVYWDENGASDASLTAQAA